jgi:Putative beta-barrel porin 2
MLFRSRGWLCTATICQALAQTADGQTGAASPTPPAAHPLSEADAWKVEEPAGEQPESTVEQQPMPETIDTPVEQEPGWSGELVGQTLENEPAQEPLQLPPDPRSRGLGILFGVIDIRPKMQFAAMYDDNILISSSNRKKDFVYTLSPGVLLGVGDYVQKEYNYITLEYVPRLTLFQHYSSFNSLEHHLRLESQYTFSRLKLRGYFEYDKLSGPNRDIGGRVNSDLYATGLEATYALSDKTSLDTDAGVTFQHYQGQIGSKEFLNHDWVNYNITPKLNVGVGGAFGVLQPESGGSQPYQQALFRVRFASTAKLSFNGNTGVEFRQFSNSGGTRVTPVFGLSANYEFSASTTFRINGSRSVTNSSSIGGDNYTATRLSGEVNQHLIGDFSLGLEGGYENDAYSQASASATGRGQREDNYFFIRPGLTYHWKDWADISLSYLYRDNNSNFPTKSFRNNQVSVEVRFSF